MSGTSFCSPLHKVITKSKIAIGIKIIINHQSDAHVYQTITVQLYSHDRIISIKTILIFFNICKDFLPVFISNQDIFIMFYQPSASV